MKSHQYRIISLTVIPEDKLDTSYPNKYSYPQTKYFIEELKRYPKFPWGYREEWQIMPFVGPWYSKYQAQQWMLWATAEKKVED